MRGSSSVRLHESRLTASIRRVRKEAVPSISLRTRASAISPQCFITSDAVTAASNNLSGAAPQYTPASEVSIHPAPVMRRSSSLPPHSTAVRFPSVITSIAPVSMYDRAGTMRKIAQPGCGFRKIVLVNAVAEVGLYTALLPRSAGQRTDFRHVAADD